MMMNSLNRLEFNLQVALFALNKLKLEL